MSRVIAITGTDTGVGKTVVACAIAAEGVARGATVGVFKPIETGVVDPHAGRDAHLLLRAAGGRQTIAEISPFTFRDPVSPMVAARQADVTIDAAVLDRAFDVARDGASLTIVEGAGGLLVPVTRRYSFASLFRRWGEQTGDAGLPLVVVAPNRLGVINHVLLTVRVANEEGLPVLGVVLNERSAGQRDASAESNASVLAEMLPTVPIIRFPWFATPLELPVLAGVCRTSGLSDLIDSRV